MINIADIISQFGLSQKETVYMSVSPVVGLEIIKVDAASKTIMTYGNRPLEYNVNLRNITDYEAFKNGVNDLFEELRINHKCNIVLNLPTVLFGQKEVPLILDDDAVREVLISEAEQSYVFKRYEPLIAWTNANIKTSKEMRTVFYSVLQKDVVDNIKNSLSEIGATLVSINITQSSIINALHFSGILAEQMNENMSWNLIVVTSSGYSICAMQGANIIDYYNEPIALNSFEGEELYSSLLSSLQVSLMSYFANFSYVISNTNLVSAKLLSSRLKDLDILTGYLENNVYGKEAIIPVSLDILPDRAANITLEAIGTAVSAQHNLPVELDFMSNLKNAGNVQDDSPVKFKIGEQNYEVTPQTAVKISAVICVILIVPVVLLAFIFSSLSKKLQSDLNVLNEQSKKLKTEIESYSENLNKETFNEAQEISKIIKNNREKLMAYSALGESVPDDLWITYFYTRKDGQVDIKGAALSVEDISAFYKNLKDSLINSKIRLYKLEMAANNIDDAVKNIKQNYLFEITNMSESELSSKSAEGVSEAQSETNAENSSSDNSKKKKSSSKKSSKNKTKGGSKSDTAQTKEQAVPNMLPAGMK